MPIASENGNRVDGVRSPARLVSFRADVVQAVREFFSCRDYQEVSTPVWVRTPALETHIDAIAAGAGYLRTSPEFHMKRLLAAGVERQWQLGPCFRAGERGRHHLPEFWMLEWYRAYADYETMLAETRELLVATARAVLGTTRLPGAYDAVELDVPWQRMTVAEAFQRHAGWNPVTDWHEDRFVMDLVGKVEPALSRGRPTVLIDYPIAEAALARASAGQPAVAERWELYAGGLELANAFSELTDAAEQRRRFHAAAAARTARGAPAYALDEGFLQALDQGLPPSAGVALGFDRLVMLLAGVSDIADISPFVEAFRDEENSGLRED